MSQDTEAVREGGEGALDREAMAYAEGAAHATSHRDDDWLEAFKLMTGHLFTHGIGSLRVALGQRGTRSHPRGECFADPADMGIEWTYCPFCGGRLAAPPAQPAVTSPKTSGDEP